MSNQIVQRNDSPVNIKSLVTHNRKSKSFIGKLPTGEAIVQESTRDEAELLIIEALAPEVASRVTYIYDRLGGRCGKRAQRGAKLLLGGHVHANGTGHTWIVDSETDDREQYDVSYDADDGGWMCSCLDWNNGAIEGLSYGAPNIGGHIGTLCKHCFSIALSRGMAA